MTYYIIETSRNKHRGMTWLNYVTDTSQNKHRGTTHKKCKWIHSEVIITSTQLSSSWERSQFEAQLETMNRFPIRLARKPILIPLQCLGSGWTNIFQLCNFFKQFELQWFITFIKRLYSHKNDMQAYTKWETILVFYYEMDGYNNIIYWLL